MPSINTLNSLQKRRPKGIALIQALLVSVVITLLALRFSYSAKDQVYVSSKIENLLEAKTRLKSVQSGILYLLFTQKLPQDEIYSDISFEDFNTWGAPVNIYNKDNVSIIVAIQDNAGLLPLQYVKFATWRKALASLGINNAEINQFVGRVSDWQDRDNDLWLLGEQEPEQLENGIKYRNNRIQLHDELSKFVDLPEEQLEQIKSISTHIAIPSMNISVAPDGLLSLLFEPDVAQYIIERRDDRVLENNEVINALGKLYNEFDYTFYSSNKYRITVKIEVNNVKVEETTEVALSRLGNQPIEIYSRSNPH